MLSVATALPEPDSSQPAKPAPVVVGDPVRLAPSADEPSTPLPANPLTPPAAVVPPVPLPKSVPSVPVASPVDQPAAVSTSAPKAPLGAPTPLAPSAMPLKPEPVAPQVENAPTVATVAPVEKSSTASSAAKAAPLFVPTGSVVETSEVAAQPAPASTVTPFAQGADAPAGGVDMQAMVDAIRATVAIAARQGSTQARIALQPEELGGIRIHLSQTSDGLLARLVGETAAGAQALEAGRTELHRTLSSLGLPLLRMDIGSQSQPQANPREERFAGRPGGGALVGVAQQEEELDGPEQVSGAENTSRHVELAGGGLVNVLA